MDIKETLFALCSADCAGTVDSAARLAAERLSRFCSCERRGHTVIGRMGAGERTLLLDAHIDEISMTVTHIDGDGFATVAPCGGIDLRTLPARAVTVHGKKELPAVFCSTPPHLGGGDTEYGDISKIKLDTLLSSAASEWISPGDTVTFRAEPAVLACGRVTGKALDNRAGVTCLLELAERLSTKQLPCGLVFLFSDQEELGLRGAKTAAYELSPDAAIVLDVSFGDGPEIDPYDCGKLSGGPMIGFSPVLDGQISRRLAETAEKEKLPFQREVMGGRTGTNADVISLTGSGVPTGLVSIPLRNMHTAVETVEPDDIEAVCTLLERWILSGGAFA